MDYDAAANYAIMNQLCKVCGEPAAGFHFGAFTCEGCKSFFGRTYNNISSISECKNNGKCVINKKNRTSCKACRLRKCMMVGMSKSGSRYGRRSNWFKIHCLLQQQQQQQQQQQPHPHHPHAHHPHHPHQQFLQNQLPSGDVTANLAAAASLLRPNPYLSPLFRNPSAPSIPNALQGVRDSASNCESDSGASSADLDDDMRSGSALSYLRPSGSPLSDKISDNDYYSKKNFHNNNNHIIKTSSPARAPVLPHAPSISPASLPAISPSIATPTAHNLLVVPNQRWLPPPFIADPAIWRELWLRGQPSVAEPAPDQDQPIDLSVKQGKKTEVGLKEEEKEVQEASGEKGDGRVGLPLDLTLNDR